jgi:hypothetical protein
VTKVWEAATIPVPAPSDRLAGGVTVATRHGERGGHVGVTRRGREVLVECGHLHINRDVSTKASGTSASDCIRQIVRAASFAPLAEQTAAAVANSWRPFADCGSYVPTSTIDRARAEAPAQVAADLELVAAVAALIGVGEATTPSPGRPVYLADSEPPSVSAPLQPPRAAAPACW